MGSGEQLESFWNQPFAWLKVNGEEMSLAQISAQHKDVSFDYLVLLATEPGLRYIEHRVPGLNICFCEKLSEEYRVFGDDSIFFETPEDRQACKSYLEDLCYRKKIHFGGYRGLDFAVAFSHGAPDSCMPLFGRRVQTGCRYSRGECDKQNRIRLFRIHFQSTEPSTWVQIFTGFMPEPTFWWPIEWQISSITGRTWFRENDVFYVPLIQSKKREHLDPVSNRSRLLEMEKILGIYFKAGPDLVTGFRRKGQGDVWWLDVFGHYFNVTICHQMCHIAADIKGSELASLKDEVKICAAMSRNFGWDDNNITTFKELAEKLECSEDLVLLYINNIDQKPKPFFSFLTCDEAIR